MVYCTLEISKGLDIILEDISTTRGIPRVCGIKGNSTPAMKKKGQRKELLAATNIHQHKYNVLLSFQRFIPHIYLIC
jgi:hypothetical protein